jgi:FAD/FMN-containing dehydrogenase
MNTSGDKSIAEDAVVLTTLLGGEVKLPLTDLAALVGDLVTPTTPSFDDARVVWNGMIDRRPGAIAKPKSETEISNLIRFAADRDLLIAVRGGGHNIAGSAVCDGGLVIDLGEMKTVSVDADARLARVGPGATLADVDAATQAHGLLVPTGINSTTGIAGLTLGGGFGWTTRKFGLTIDKLKAVRMVLATGQSVTASADENTDLFWGVRGGGGNFGVVTEFTFELGLAGPEVFAGLAVHPATDAVSVLMSLQQAVDTAPDELTIWAVLRKAPPLPFLPEAWHGQPVVILPFCFIGDPADRDAVTQAVTSIGHPIAVHAGPMPFCDWQKSFDPLLTEGARNYWKSHDIAAITSPVAEVAVALLASLPTDECEIFFGSVGGAATRVPPAATAFPNRNAHYAVNIHTRWRDPVDDERCIAWARKAFDDFEPLAMGTRYVNFIPEGDFETELDNTYGDNLARLRELKAKWDPDNLFRSNVNLAAG